MPNGPSATVLGLAPVSSLAGVGLQFLSPRVPSKLPAVLDRSMSSSSVGGEGGYGGEEVVCVLEHVEDSYDGVIIDDKG